MTSGALDRLLVVFTVVALLTAGGCSLFRAKGPAAPVLREDLSLLKPEEFPAKIKQLDEISRNRRLLLDAPMRLAEEALAKGAGSILGLELPAH